LRESALPRKIKIMKIKATNSNTLIHIVNGAFSGTSDISESDSAIILGMNRAYNKLRSRIKREGLYSLALSEQAESRIDQGYSTLSRI
jgi:hypothetical protein